MSAPVFRQRLSNAATTYHDVFRLFHRDADSLSDEDIEHMIRSPLLQPWNHLHRNSLHTLLRTNLSQRNTERQADDLLLGIRNNAFCAVSFLIIVVPYVSSHPGTVRVLGTTTSTGKPEIRHSPSKNSRTDDHQKFTWVIMSYNCM